MHVDDRPGADDNDDPQEDEGEEENPLINSALRSIKENEQVRPPP
jgi:hypothetical protein